ncbi:hypothetical protein T06_5517, partial [Trichinella sp. T6]
LFQLSSKIRLSSGQVQVTMEGAMRGIATANLAQGWLEISIQKLIFNYYTSCAVDSF